ncbi:MAG: hypothetical protein ACK5KO_03440 [Arachnia sp.]
MATHYWQANLSDSDGPPILVDLMLQDTRAIIRSLTVATGIQRANGGRLIGFLGADPEWEYAVWDYHDLAAVEDLARAYGVSDFVHLGELADEIASGRQASLVIHDERIEVRHSDLDPAAIEAESISTALRILRIPRDGHVLRSFPETQPILDRAAAMADIYYSLITQLNPAALVVTHVDYSSWGLGVQTAMKHDVPVVHVQSTGSLKAYAWFPENATSGSFRAQMTTSIAKFFDETLWPQRKVLRRAAELTTSRVKRDTGRPSWWRAGGALALSSREDRADMRRLTSQRLGIDPDKPVIGVFAHAQSDALGSNVELFDDFVDWLRSTTEYAAAHPEVTWLFLDHPAQFRYDQTDFFSSLADDNTDHEHMLFMPSMDLRKNALWSLVDLAVTVRGSVSNEFPAFGIPALQAGWSEWSHLGFSILPTSREGYFQELSEAIGRALAGESMLSAQEVERARIWQWLYRGGADVASMLVPPWQMGQADRMHFLVRLAMNNVEADCDAALTAVRRMWQRREPLLLGFDSSRPLAEELALVSAEEDFSVPAYPLQTRFDQHSKILSGSTSIESGLDDALLFTDGIVLGEAVLGRINSPRCTIAFRYQANITTRITFTVRLTLDTRSDSWWESYVDGPYKTLPPPTRRPLAITFMGTSVVTEVLDSPEEQATVDVTFSVPGREFPSSHLVALELVSNWDPADGSEPPSLLSGIQVDDITVQVTPERTLGD